MPASRNTTAAPRSRTSTPRLGAQAEAGRASPSSFFQSNAEHELIEPGAAGAAGQGRVHPASTRPASPTPAWRCAMRWPAARHPVHRGAPVATSTRASRSASTPISPTSRVGVISGLGAAGLRARAARAAPRWRHLTDLRHQGQ
ncbi:MAG: hypothetical protein MZV65_37565 [Chromatiales bacterium]|nr:hypothetical protein [Chromatiales bacterium]